MPRPAGKLTLVADLGSCLVESDTALASSLPPEEAALYECIKLRVRDVSAYAVDGDFSFSAIQDSAGAGEVRCRDACTPARAADSFPRQALPLSDVSSS